MTVDPAAAAVSITPTPAVVGEALTVTAPDLNAANRAMVELAAHRGAGWPADVRFAAPLRPTIAVTAALAATVGDRLPDATLVTADGIGSVPDGVDVLVTSGPPGDGCAVGLGTMSVLARPFDDAVALDVAAALTGVTVPAVWPLSAADAVELVVFGAHLRGGPLTHQLTELGARWAGELTTAARYRMTVLDSTPAKPAVTRVPDNVPGTALYGHRWLMSAAALGRFLTALPAPMQLGKVEFADGSWRTAFGCDAAAATGADISSYGSWPAAVAAGAVS
jgi:allophanate hydrolase